MLKCLFLVLHTLRSYVMKTVKAFNDEVYVTVGNIVSEGMGTREYRCFSGRKNVLRIT